MEARPSPADAHRPPRPVEFEPPRLTDLPAFVVAGLRERHTPETMEEIAFLWRRFMPHVGRLAGQVGGAAYGVCFNSDRRGNFDYLAGVEVLMTTQLPSKITTLSIARQRYAVFTHRGHISTIARSWAEIFERLLSEAGLCAVTAPSFERYDQRFDPASDAGEVEIWVPIQGTSLPMSQRAFSKLAKSS